MTAIAVDPSLVAAAGNALGSIGESMTATVNKFANAVPNLSSDLGGGDAGNSANTFTANADQALRGLQKSFLSFSNALATATNNLWQTEGASTESIDRHGSAS